MAPRSAGVLFDTLIGLLLAVLAMCNMTCNAARSEAVYCNAPLIFGACLGLGFGLVTRLFEHGVRISLPFVFELTAAVAIVVTTVTHYLDAVSREFSSTRRGRCEMNLSEVWSGVHAYLWRHGSFPQAYMCDAEGRKMHSWRIAVLPNLEGGDLHARYDFSQPWNSPANLALAEEVRDVYTCPSDPPFGPHFKHANYLAVTGPDTLWGAAWSKSSHRANRNLGHILLVVETVPLDPNDRIATFEPRDLELADIWPGSAPGRRGPSSYHPGGFNALFADGRVEFISSNSLQELEDLVIRHRAAVRAYLEEMRKVTPAPWERP